MTTVTKYPTSSGANPDSWTSPDNALGAEDGVCTYKTMLAGGNKYLWLSGYGFAIPAGAIIDNVFIDHKGIIAANVEGNILSFSFIHEFQTVNDNGSDTLLGASCASVAYKGEYDVLPDLAGGRTITVDDLNNEVFTTCLHATCLFPNAVFRVDAAYIRVVYHVPVVIAGGSQGENSVIAVFAGIQGYLHKRKQRRFIATLK